MWITRPDAAAQDTEQAVEHTDGARALTGVIGHDVATLG